MSAGADTRQRIEQAALELFLVRGYVGTPVRVIAKAAHVTTPALYWHYKSKDELCASILTRVYREFDELLRAAVKDGSPEEQLRAYVEASVSLNLLRDILRKGDALGIFHVLDTTITALAIISMANYAFTWCRAAASPTVEEVAASYADYAVRLARGQLASDAEPPKGAP